MDRNFVTRLFTLYCKLLRPVLNILPKEVSFKDTKCRKQLLKFIWNTWKYRWIETDDETSCVDTTSLNFEICYLDFPFKIVLVFFFQGNIYIQRLQNAKKTVIYTMLFACIGRSVLGKLGPNSWLRCSRLLFFLLYGMILLWKQLLCGVSIVAYSCVWHFGYK